MDDYEELIGANIRRLREASGLSQAALAKLMNERGWTKWSQPTVAAIEKGERSLKFAEAMTLVNTEIFDVPRVEELLRVPRVDIWWATMANLATSVDAVKGAVRDFWSAQLRAARASDELLAAGEEIPEPDEMWLAGCDIAEIIAELDIRLGWELSRGIHETALIEGPLRPHLRSDLGKRQDGTPADSAE
ncbi:helix-turn-helix transcriptional regulator [Microbacterium soli]